MYSRATCALCDRAREVILDARADLGFEYEEVLVDGRRDLEGRYGIRVPVVLVDGEERFEIEVEPSALREALGAPGGGSSL